MFTPRILGTYPFAKLLLGATLALTGLLSAAQGTGVPPWLQTPWKESTPMPEPLEELYATPVGNGIFVFGGLSKGIIPKGLVYHFDAGTAKWEKRKNMALPAHHTAVAQMNGKIFLIGGFVQEGAVIGWKPIADAMEYDPANDTWRALAPMSVARGSAVAMAVNGKIYVIGGSGMSPGETPRAVNPFEPQRTMNLVEEYDPATNTWRTRTPMSTPRNHAFFGEVGGKIYVIGGRVGTPFVGTSSSTDVTEVYDPATDKWGAPLAPLPTSRSGGASGVYNGRIYTAGGEFQDGRMMAAFRAVEAYDVASNTWITMPKMLIPRHGLAGAFVGSTFHLISGDVQSSAPGGPQTTTPRHDVLDVSALPK